MATYLGFRGQYVLSVSPSVQIQGSLTGEGTDILKDIERLQFRDLNVALDLDGNAGMVAKIIGTVFGEPMLHNKSFVGIGLSFADSGLPYGSLMQLALDVKLGPGASSTQVVQLIYTNVIGVAPEPGTLTYFVGMIDSGSFSKAGLAVYAAETGYNAANINLTGLAHTGLEYV